MKKYRGLSRCQLGGYILWLFGALFAPFMFIKVSAALVIILEVIAVLALASLICAHVFFAKNKRNLYVILSFAGHGADALLILVGLIFEIVLAISGQVGLYAIIMLPLCTVLYALLGFFLVKINLKVINGTIDKDKFER